MKSHKTVNILCLILVLLLSCDNATACNGASWAAYKAKFQKKYKTLASDLQHRYIYCGNLEMINAHNERYKRGEETYEMGINQFADWTHAEFKNWISGGKIPEKY